MDQGTRIATRIDSTGPSTYAPFMLRLCSIYSFGENRTRHFVICVLMFTDVVFCFLEHT